MRQLLSPRVPGALVRAASAAFSFACLAAGPWGIASCGSHSPAEATQLVEAPLEQCPSSWVEGIDVFDGQGLVDWAAVAGDGVAFAWIKATQGTYDVQATFQSNWAGAARAGIARGAYHFFDPTEDGAAQAERFLATVGQLEPGDLPPMVDIECPSGASSCLYAGASGNAAPAEITSRLWAFVRGVEVATSRKPVLYTYEAYFSANALDTAGFGAYPLFLAQPFTRSNDAGVSCLDVPPPWQSAQFWQYSWSGEVAGIAPAVDRDRFLGTLAQLVSLAAPLPSAAVSSGQTSAPTSSYAPCTGPPGLPAPVPRASWEGASDPAPVAPTAARVLAGPGYAMQTTDIRKGIKIQIDGVPYAVVEHQFVKPGKGQAFTRARIKNLSTGAVIERTWKSGESVELADVETRKMSFSWDEGDSLVFMDTNTGDQVHVMKDTVGDEVRFLSEGLDCEVTIYNGNPIGIELPPSVVLQVKESEPGVKGDTASGATKPATVSTGTVINVPLFIKEGEWVKVDTRTGDYLERVNK